MEQRVRRNQKQQLHQFGGKTEVPSTRHKAASIQPTGLILGHRGSLKKLGNVKAPAEIINLQNQQMVQVSRLHQNVQNFPQSPNNSMISRMPLGGSVEDRGSQVNHQLHRLAPHNTQKLKTNLSAIKERRQVYAASKDSNVGGQKLTEKAASGSPPAGQQ